MKLDSFKQKLRAALGLNDKKKLAMQAYQAAAENFLLEHGNIPGVLKVELDNLFSKSIIVFFDKKKLPKASIPSKYEGYDVSLYDVRQVLKSSNAFLNKVKKEGVDITEPSNKHTFDQFTKTVSLCKEMLA